MIRSLTVGILLFNLAMGGWEHNRMVLILSAGAAILLLIGGAMDACVRYGARRR